MKLQNLLLLSASFAFVACAGQTYDVNVGPMFVRVKGEVALQNALGSLVLHDNQQSIGGNLGLDDTEVAPYIRASTDIGRHRVRADGFYIDAEGAGTLAGAVPPTPGGFGGISSGTQVTTSLEFFAITTAYAYELLREERYRVAIGGKIGFYSLDVEARAPVGREKVTTEVIVPMPYLEVEAFWGPVTVGANGGIMAGDFGDASGRYWDLEAYGKWQATEVLDFTVGYRYVLLDGYGRADSRDFDADVDVQGAFITAGVRF